MKPSRAAEVIRQLWATPWPVFLWGPPGVGKSSIVRQVAEQQGASLIDIRASLLDPTDLRGIPAIVDGRAQWCPPSFLPGVDAPGGVLFFDELSAAPPLVQASLYQLVLDRRVGEYQLPEGWRIIAAGNRAEDRSVVFRMPAALANRFVHLDFEVDYDDWRHWAVTRSIHPLIIAFLGFRRELLSNAPDGRLAYPTPRSWAMASDAAKSMGFGQASADVFVGIVGEGAAVELLRYCDQALTEAAVLKILADPAHADLPHELAGLYALVSYVASRARDEEVADAGGALLGRLPAEFAVLLARDLIKLRPSLVSKPWYIGFVKQHRELVL